MRTGERSYEDILELFSENVRKAVDNASSVSIDEEIDKVVLFGLGEQGVVAKLIKDYFKDKLSITVVNSEMPNWVNSKTLVFVLSFDSKDEAVDIYRESLRKGAKIVVVSFEGKLETLCTKQGRKYIKMPYGIDEKGSFPYFFFSVLAVLHNSNLIEDQSIFVKDVIKTLEKKDVFRSSGLALAKRVRGKVPLIYTTPKYNSVGNGWKISMNNIAGVHAFTNGFPEIFYSELNGFEKLNGYYYVVVIRDSEGNMKTRKMFEEFKKDIKIQGVDILEIGISGGCYLTRLFSAVYMGM